MNKILVSRSNNFVKEVLHIEHLFLNIINFENKIELILNKKAAKLAAF